MNTKGFLTAGIAIVMAMVLIIAANYVLSANKELDSSSYRKMMIDKVNYRATDVYRIYKDVGCVEANITTATSAISSALSTEGLTIASTTTCPITFTIEAPGITKKTVLVS